MSIHPVSKSDGPPASARCSGRQDVRTGQEQALLLVPNVNAAIDVLHPDLHNSGGFLANKRMADLADLYFLAMANHNTGSIVNGMATVHWESTVPFLPWHPRQSRVT